MSRKIWAIILCAILCAAMLTACSSDTKPVQYDSLSELSKVVGFDVADPMTLPEGYALAGYYAVGNDLAQIVYVNGDIELIIAKTTLQKVECDFGEFEETKAVDVNGVSFDFSLSGGTVRLAVARAGGFSYAIYSKTGLTEPEMTDVAKSLALVNQ